MKKEKRCLEDHTKAELVQIISDMQNYEFTLKWALDYVKEALTRGWPSNERKEALRDIFKCVTKALKD
jgi:hypothetical protein